MNTPLEQIKERIDGLKEYRHLDLPDSLIRKLDVLQLLPSIIQEVVEETLGAVERKCEANSWVYDETHEDMVVYMKDVTEICKSLASLKEESKRERAVKSEYRSVDRRPIWVTFYTDTGEIISEEKYTHQDQNFSNMCAHQYCRCSE